MSQSDRPFFRMTVLMLILGVGCARAADPPAMHGSDPTTSVQAALAEFRRQTMLQVGDAQHPTTPTEFMFIGAAIAGDRDLIDWLKRHGGNVDVITPPSSATAMHLAVLDENTTAVRLLLEAGAFPDTYDRSSGSAALFDATNLNNLELIGLLLEHRADPNVRQWGLALAPLHSAVTDGKEAIALRLLAHGANPNQGDARGVTPLHLAVSLKREPMVRLLLARGADPNQASQAGTTPLMVARRNESAEIIALLKEAGAVEKPDPLKR